MKNLLSLLIVMVLNYHADAQGHTGNTTTINDFFDGYNEHNYVKLQDTFSGVM